MAFVTTTGFDRVIILCPVGNGGFGVYLDGQTDSLTIKRADPNAPNTNVHTDPLGRVSVRRNTAYVVGILVSETATAATVEVSVNGKMYGRGTAPLAVLQYPCHLRLPEPRRPAFGVCGGTVAFTKVRFCLISGTASWAKLGTGRSIRQRLPQAGERLSRSVMAATPKPMPGATAGLPSSAEPSRAQHCWTSQQWHPGQLAYFNVPRNRTSPGAS